MRKHPIDKQSEFNAAKARKKQRTAPEMVEAQKRAERQTDVAAKMLAALGSLPQEEWVDVLAVVSKVVIEFPHHLAMVAVKAAVEATRP